MPSKLAWSLEGATERTVQRFRDALNAVLQSNLFTPDQYSQTHVDNLSQALRSRLASGQASDVAQVLAGLTRETASCHAVVQLAVQAVCVKALSKNITSQPADGDEDEDVEESAPDEEEDDWWAAYEDASDADDPPAAPDRAPSEPVVTPQSLGTGGQQHELSGKTPAQITNYLMDLLQEPETTRGLFRDIAKTCGADGVWSLLQDMQAEINASGNVTQTVQGTRPRTPGGVFISLYKKRKAELRMKAELQAAEVYELRPYQQEVVETIWKQGGNWVVAAPTNTGKTAIFIELARRHLSVRPDGNVVVVVPTVSLTRQQSIAFVKGGFAAADGSNTGTSTGPIVDWFCGDKPLPRDAWREEIGRTRVVVMEAQSFANLLSPAAPGAGSPPASLADITLLILDECHHAAKDHPYARIMHHWHEVDAPHRPQVVGVSASPANGKSEAQVERALLELQERLGRARIMVVGDDDQRVREVAPAPTEEESRLPAREADGDLQEWLRHTMHAYALLLDAELTARLSDPTLPTSSHDETVTLIGGRAPTARDVQGNQVEAYGQLCRWLNNAMHLAREWHLVNLAQGVHVLEVLRRAEALCEDVGYECALQYTLHRLAVLCATRHLPVRHRGSSTTKSTATATASKLTSSLSEGVRSGSGEGSITGAKRGPASQHGSSTSGRSGSRLGDLRLDVQAYQAGTVSAKELQAAQQAARPLARLTPCKDVALTAVALCRSFLLDLTVFDGRTSPLSPRSTAAALLKQAPAGSNPPAVAMPSPGRLCANLTTHAITPLLPGALTPAVAHPKVWALVQYLQRYQDRQQFHGIIFCRSRQGAHFLVDLMRAARLPPATSASGTTATSAAGLLGFVDDVILFVGHGGGHNEKSKTSMRAGGVVRVAPAGQTLSLTPGGMDVRQQTRALEAFKAPGRRLLVATNAAEEGLDVPCCDFVVRYTPPASGTQRVQGRGRARKHDAQYMCLIQDKPGGALQHGGADVHIDKKSRAEEAHQRKVLARQVEAQRAADAGRSMGQDQGY